MKMLSLVILLTSSTAPFLPAPVAADGSCFDPAGLGLLGSASGSVTTSSSSAWYVHDHLGAAQYTLTPFDGDADLYVWNNNCTVLLCQSLAGGSAVDACAAGIDSANPVPFRHKVQVLYYHSDDNIVDFELRVVA